MDQIQRAKITTEHQKPKSTKNSGSLNKDITRTGQPDGNIAVDGRYTIDKKIGKGSFGDVYIGQDLETGRYVGVKLEKGCNTSRKILRYEYQVYQTIYQSPSRSKPRIPVVHWFGMQDIKGTRYQVLVMEYLGNSLDFLFHHRCQGKFSAKTTVMLGIQMLDLISCLHSCGYIHRDIKPDNFLMGFGQHCHDVYLIDLGLAKRFKDKAHIKEQDGNKLVGTARYASINSHIGVELSRRDDLESLGYLLVYFLNGELPWQGLKASDRDQKYQLIGAKKQETTIAELCKPPTGNSNNNVYHMLYKYFQYVKALGFKQRPDYGYLRELFCNWMLENQLQYDYFDWE